MKRTIELMSMTEKIINEALRMALRERSAEKSVEVFLKHLGKESGCERIYIFEGGKGECVSNTFEWCAEGISKEKDNLQHVPFEAVAWWYDEFEEKNSIIIEDLETIKETEPLTYEYLKPQNIHSLIASPLSLENHIIGFYGVDNPPKEIMNHISDIAEIIGHFITSLLEKRKLEEELKKLSFWDALSGVQNRNAFNHYVNSNKVLKNMGIVYCDVLSLKKINDVLGHQAGDDLIIQAGNCLKSCFRKTDIYRVGGDEFLVLCEGVTKELFWSRIEILRKEMEDKKAKMSLGCLWKKDITDIDAAIAEADALMYQEKREYYANKATEEDKRC